MSGYGQSYGAPALDQEGHQQQQNLNARQHLISSLMQPSQQSNSGWGGLANAGSMIAGALAQMGLQGQQYGINQGSMQRAIGNNVQAQQQMQANAFQPQISPQNQQISAPQQLLTGQIQ